jgi:hypothetical protein
MTITFFEGQVLFSNWQIAARLQDAAEKLSFKFAKFNDEFMHSNIGKQVPSKLKYITMYLNNNSEIEE